MIYKLITMKKIFFIGVFCASMAFVACSNGKEQGQAESQNGINSTNKTEKVTKTSEPVTDCTSDELAELSQILKIEATNQDDIKLFRELASWSDTPYKSAGVDKDGADCSGFVVTVFKNVYDVKLPRKTVDIYGKVNTISKDDAQAGDLVFFNTDGKTDETPNYMGIYLKDNRFVIMSSKGFKAESLESSYYKKNFVCVGRVE